MQPIVDSDESLRYASVHEDDERWLPKHTGIGNMGIDGHEYTVNNRLMFALREKK
jgi:hypothetical protein